MGSIVEKKHRHEWLQLDASRSKEYHATGGENSSTAIDPSRFTIQNQCHHCLLREKRRSKEERRKEKKKITDKNDLDSYSGQKMGGGC